MAATDTDRLAAEYEVLQEGCGLVDRSERGKLALSGAGAIEFLNGQVTNELADLRPGEGRYAAFLTNKGKMLGDLRILALSAGGEHATGPEDSSGERGVPGQEPPGQGSPAQESLGAIVDELLIDTERVALQGLFDMIRRYKIGYEVQLHKRTLECALLALIGPGAAAVAGRASGNPEAALPHSEHAHLRATVGGRAVRLIATWEGLEVLCDAPDHDAVAAALLEAGARAVGESAAEIVRVEHGRPRYGVDLDESTIPQEADLNERAVSFTKGCYVGQETVARLYYRGKPNRHLRGLRLSGPASSGEELRLGERTVGTPTPGQRGALPRPRRLGAGAPQARGGPRGHARGRRARDRGATVLELCSTRPLLGAGAGRVRPGTGASRPAGL